MHNKKNISLVILLILTSQILLLSCSNSVDSPDIGIGEDYVNHQILLRTPSFSNSFKSGDPVNLELKYNSNNEIVFPNDYNLKIFVKTNGEWIEIKEKPTVRLPSGNIIFSPTKSMSAVEDIFVSPEFQNIAQKYQLRIYVIGDMTTNNGSQKVAAYTDIQLNP